MSVHAIVVDGEQDVLVDVDDPQAWQDAACAMYGALLPDVHTVEVRPRPGLTVCPDPILFDWSRTVVADD